MSTMTRYHPRGIDVDLADLPHWLYVEIASLHGQLDKSGPPILTCLGNGEPMYVWRHESGRFFARHFPGGAGNKHSHAISAMSDEHRRIAEYSERAAEDAGLSAQLEYSTGKGTRLDVAVFGEVNTGIEVQRSSLSRVLAKSRTSKSFSAGFVTAWISDSQRTPDWAHHVPTAFMTTRGGWSERLPDRNTANVSIGEFTRERDGRRWRYQRRPLVVTLDELTQLIPAGEIVPVAVGTKGAVSLALKGAREVIDSCTYPGASVWHPSSSTPRTREAAQRFSKPCSRHESPAKCEVCGLPINPVFQTSQHFDCARKRATE